jgi:predicted class III extradiol MEMO1 family dioxygenase
VFVLGPSHHVYLRNCALSTQTHYETPVGDLTLDLEGNPLPPFFSRRHRSLARSGIGSHTTALRSPPPTPVMAELMATGHFGTMEKDVDEDEHSIEMQLPYLAKIFERYHTTRARRAHDTRTTRHTTRNRKAVNISFGIRGRHEVKVVPVLVGSLDKQSEELFGGVFARYLDDPENFFVISSDFCHWGKRYPPSPHYECVSCRVVSLVVSLVVFVCVAHS